jgi:hypothetical protein
MAGDRRGGQILPPHRETTSKVLSTNYLKRGKNQNFLDDLSNSGPAVRRYK